MLYCRSISNACTSFVTDKPQSSLIGVICEFQPGWIWRLTRGKELRESWYHLGYIRGEECVRACITYKKEFDSRIIGVTDMSQREVFYLFKIIFSIGTSHVYKQIWVCQRRGHKIKEFEKKNPFPNPLIGPMRSMDILFSVNWSCKYMFSDFIKNEFP